jgi:phosphoribosylanthranilate isomerase
LARRQELRLSGHLCGSWVRDLVEAGQFAFPTARPTIWPVFQRLQLNYKPHRSRVNAERLIPALVTGRQYIFQASTLADESLVKQARAAGVDAVPLFDKSGGKGQTPASWSRPYPGVYCGYAGGLGPEDLPEQLKAIEAVAGEVTVWIDMQSKVRTADGSGLDLSRVRRCLELSLPRIRSAFPKQESHHEHSS